MKRKICFLLIQVLFVVTVGSLSVQAQDYAASKEKIYVQTNHVFFKPGDVLYFKLYIVNAKDQLPTNVSKVVYTELISPSGTVLQKANYPVQDGYAEGSFDLGEQAAGGIYKIKSYTSWMQNEREETFFSKEITVQKTIAPRILMKLNFPEKGYGPGSSVKADFSMRNLQDEPIRNYDGKYSVSIGGSVISTQPFKTNKDGKAEIHFTLPADLSVNDGLLNVTVEYDAFTESVSRSIPIVLNKIDLQFMPEGGTLVEGLSNYMAFKAVNEFGKAADIKGEIKDAAGNKVTDFESYHFGMGKFLFTPQPGQTYKAVITSPAGITQQYVLPKAAKDGVVMRVSKKNKKIVLTITTSEEMDLKLRGSFRNTTYLLQNLYLQEGENEIKVDENIFPAGIAVFTLSDVNEIPLAERLVFMNEDQQLNVQISFDKEKYLPREKVKLSLQTLDEKGKAVASDFSLSVVDDKLWTMADDKQDHILSWILLSSELKGKVEEPQFYFKKEEPRAVPALDLLMLTQGYRYFDYIEYVLKEGSLKFIPDQDNILSGQVLDTLGKPIQARMFLINTVAGGKAMPVTTDENGYFFFSDLLPAQGYYLFAQSLNRRERVSINVQQNGLGFNRLRAGDFKPAIVRSVQNEKIIPGIIGAPALQQPMKMIAAASPKLFAENILVGNEVVVTAVGTRTQARELGFAVTHVRGDNINNGVNLQNGLTGKVAGLQIIQTGNFFADTRITLRGIRSLTGNNEPLIVINGIPVERMSLNTLNPNDVESVTVLKDAAATAIYGASGANGAILIDTKKYRKEKIRIRFTANNYYASAVVYTKGTAYTAVRKFYAPVYTSTFTEERNDFRETVYWNPVVQTDKNGKATLEFYNSDASTTFRAIAEGIGYNGILGRGEATYATQNALQADVKIPPYLTVGDKTLIPLVIKNNGDADATFTITVQAPETFRIGQFNNTPLIKAGSSVQVLIPAEAITAGNGKIQFLVTGPSGKENISLPIAATDKGFPVKLTFSGNQPADIDFMISKMIPGTLHSQLKLFKNLEGQLLDGIESMLREPYGCFEQTSSSTYPNILVLRYLKESGRSNPEIEKKALGYIEDGYKRLVGFETAQDGFEWFGHTPPHEALTAYGLLEFTDMQEFIPVDKKMLERTKRFLLNRRNGKGNFNLSTGGYDRFASVPNKIANVYIVYALTQAGIGKEIQKEYETAIKQALESKDGYQLSMMAIAAHSMKDKDNYERMLAELEKLQSKESLNAETSVVNSRDASLRVETNSLYAIALMKAPSPDLAKIAGLITKILAEKSYYGYGSTQATVLALKAIVDYYRIAGHVSDDAPVQFTINSNRVTEDSTVNSQLMEGNNSFSVNYTDKNKAIPYNLEVSYSTFTPPNSVKAELQISTALKGDHAKMGETVRMDIRVNNTKAVLQPMAIAKVGIPAGLSVQPWQLKEIMESNKVAYYEIFDNYLVFYWMGFAPNETKTISLDLKADIPGTYKAKASTAYLYYTPEYKNWSEGTEIVINADK